MIEFQYHSSEEAEKFSFYQIPKELFSNPRYKYMSLLAKALYGLLRDRNQLSIKNNWIDQDGHIFIIFTREEAGELLNFKIDTITKTFKELVNIGLIKEVRQGLTKPNIIYVGKIIPETSENNLNPKKSESGSRKNRGQEAEKIAPNNTDIKDTDLSDTTTYPEETRTEEEIKKDVVVVVTHLKKVFGEETAKLMTNKTAQSLVKNYGLNSVLQAIDYTKGKDTQNIVGYIRKSLEDSNGNLGKTANKVKKNNKIPQMNFEQHHHAEDEFEIFYKTIK